MPMPCLLMAFRQIILLVLKLLYADALFVDGVSTDNFVGFEAFICRRLVC